MSTIKFYTDTHVPKAVAAQLQARGVDVMRCEDVDMAEADEEEHLEYATALWEHHAEWLRQGLRHCGIVLFNNRLQGDTWKVSQRIV